MVAVGVPFWQLCVYNDAHPSLRETAMAGSLKFFVYETDLGDPFGLFADESNVEAIGGSSQDAGTVTVPTYQLPRNIRPRYAVYSNAAKTRNISIPIPTQALYNALQTATPTITDPIAGTGTLSLTRKVPERMRLMPIAADTGLDDGDAT